jgi:hypothetical protein
LYRNLKLDIPNSKLSLVEKSEFESLTNWDCQLFRWFWFSKFGRALKFFRDNIIKCSTYKLYMLYLYYSDVSIWGITGNIELLTIFMYGFQTIWSTDSLTVFVFWDHYITFGTILSSYQVINWVPDYPITWLTDCK